jgi:ATP-dependent protease ClpP protease subunit
MLQCIQKHWASSLADRKCKESAIDMQLLNSSHFNAPKILLSGTVDYEMYKSFRAQLDSANKDGLVVTELSTLGGDPEVARMMGEDIRFHSENHPASRFAFLGKAAIYSAGTTFMSFFASENRYLTRGTRLMIHERKLDKKLHISGPLTTCIATVKATLNEIEASIAIQNEGFQNLILGSKVTMEEVLQKAPSNWYIEANEAKRLALVADVV